MAGCRPQDAPAVVRRDSALTVGFGLATGQDPRAGVLQAIRNIALEGLVAIGRDGRPQPWLAKEWSAAPDNLALRVRLQPGAAFHDGAMVTAAEVCRSLEDQLPRQMGPAFADVEAIRTVSDLEILITLRKRSVFLLESLDVPIQGAGELIGTGPFVAEDAVDGRFEMRANTSYHGGSPQLQRIVFNPYSSVRSAWADMLRGRLDMLYEVGVDALGSFEKSNKVAVFTFTRPYQYVVVLNPRRPDLASAEVRRALNAAIDRAAIVKDGLEGLAVESKGPVNPSHWAFRDDYPAFRFDPKSAAASLSRRKLGLRVLVPPGATYERISLLLKRQLEALDVAVTLVEIPLDQVGKAFADRSYDAILLDLLSGPTIFRPYRWWHSQGPQNQGFSSPAVDDALDQVRHAASDAEYRAGVEAFQRAVVQDPPAIFLAWSQRARAVSTRFDVPVEQGRDILSTLRLWRPLSAAQAMSPN
jgi:peptide/nickel transport system substrate-binding protein